MRKFLSLALLVLLFITIGGYYYWFRISREINYSRVRTELNGAYDSTRLVRLTISFPELHKIKWIRQDREFEYEGEMYDVKSMERTPDHMVFHCMRDSRETRMVESMNRRVRHEHERNEFFKKIPIQLFLVGERNRGITQLHSERLMAYCLSLYHSLIPETHTPPPVISFS